MNERTSPVQTFRFDDVSINTDVDKLYELTRVIRHFQPSAQILLCISPVVFTSRQLPSGQSERVHPSYLTAMSALTPYYEGEWCGLPAMVHWKDVTLAGHGIAHVDHRLLGRDAQELSILMSCALAKAQVFVPPYNHWNIYTEVICKENGIELVKFEDGWQHMLHNPFDSQHLRFYMHPYDMNVPELQHWFSTGRRDGR